MLFGLALQQNFAGLDCRVCPSFAMANYVTANTISCISHTQGTMMHACLPVRELQQFECTHHCIHRCYSALLPIHCYDVPRHVVSNHGLLCLQDMSNEDQETQNQMIHLDTEIKLMKAWMIRIAHMINILHNADKVLSLLPGSADSPPASPKKGSQSVTEPLAEPLGKPVCHAGVGVRHFTPGMYIKRRAHLPLDS